MTSYEFDPELAPLVPRMARIDYTDVETARKALREITAAMPRYEPREPVAAEQRVVPGELPVPVRVYRPAGATRTLPGVVYLHGGGFVLGDLDMADSAATRVADLAEVVVVSVDYRLAPEHPFPAGLQDCYAALEWAVAEAADLGIDADRMGVAGESAGGGLAAAVALLARDRGGPRLRHQCLVNPELDDRLDTPSARAFVDTPKWDRDNAAASWRHYLGGLPSGAAVPELAAPARAVDLAGLPPAFVSAGEFDPLRDEAISFAHRLIQAGVRTELRYYPGTFHASYTAPAAVSRQMLADQVDAIRRALHA
jgi:acetyl esterase/lipase